MIWSQSFIPWDGAKHGKHKRSFSTISHRFLMDIRWKSAQSPKLCFCLQSGHLMSFVTMIVWFLAVLGEFLRYLMLFLFFSLVCLLHTMNNPSNYWSDVHGFLHPIFDRYQTVFIPILFETLLVTHEFRLRERDGGQHLLHPIGTSGQTPLWTISGYWCYPSNLRLRVLWRHHDMGSHICSFTCHKWSTPEYGNSVTIMEIIVI